MGFLTKIYNFNTHIDLHETQSQGESESRSIGGDESPTGCAVEEMTKAAEMKWAC